MTDLSRCVLDALNGKTLATAESCTGGLIGAVLTAIPGSSSVYKGGIVSYTNEVKEKIIGVSREVLEQYGAVSEQVAASMAANVRKMLNTDYAVSVTGLAGPGGDDFGNKVGTVFVGFDSCEKTIVQKFCFAGNRDEVRRHAVCASLRIVLDNISS